MLLIFVILYYLLSSSHNIWLHCIFWMFLSHCTCIFWLWLIMFI